ncbi:MAG: GtrA family protein [Ferroplasma sp.]
MILKYLKGKITDGAEFDYVFVSLTTFNNDFINGILKDLYKNDFDIALINGKKSIIKSIYAILIKLSLSVKRGKMLPCASIYSKNAYIYLESMGINPDNFYNNVIANSILLKNRDFTYKLYNVNGKCTPKIGFKEFIDIILRKGNMLKYVIVGITGVIVNELVLLLLHKPLGSDLSIIPAIEISIIYNFVLNNKFTFKGRTHFYYRLLKYNAFNLIGFIANLAVYYSALYFRSNIYIADFLGIIVAFIITYTTATMIVW